MKDDIVKEIPTSAGSDSVRCPRCGSLDVRVARTRRHRKTRYREVLTGTLPRCARCGYTGSFETWDADEPKCNLDDAELASDQATLKDVLTRKKP